MTAAFLNNAFPVLVHPDAEAARLIRTLHDDCKRECRETGRSVFAWRLGS
jgi:hypothetical protein